MPLIFPYDLFHWTVKVIEHCCFKIESYLFTRDYQCDPEQEQAFPLQVQPPKDFQPPLVVKNKPRLCCV